MEQSQQHPTYECELVSPGDKFLTIFTLLLFVLLPNKIIGKLSYFAPVYRQQMQEREAAAAKIRAAEETERKRRREQIIALESVTQTPTPHWSNVMEVVWVIPNKEQVHKTLTLPTGHHYEDGAKIVRFKDIVAKLPLLPQTLAVHHQEKKLQPYNPFFAHALQTLELLFCEETASVERKRMLQDNIDALYETLDGYNTYARYDEVMKMIETHAPSIALAIRKSRPIVG